jgi:colicin import membrane protein
VAAGKQTADRRQAEERRQAEARQQAEREAEQREAAERAAEEEIRQRVEAARLARLATLEKRAKLNVDYAKKLIDAGETPAKDLRDRLDKIIRDFAGTPSAEEAKRLRAELKE